jgi:hypothetical protein
VPGHDRRDSEPRPTRRANRLRQPDAIQRTHAPRWALGVDVAASFAAPMATETSPMSTRAAGRHSSSRAPASRRRGSPGRFSVRRVWVPGHSHLHEESR